MGRRPLLAVITGPTASGKTSLAIDIASHFSTEIVSADSRQVYADIPIGTAAPAPGQLARVRHHLVGFLPLEASYSAARFEQDALRILGDIWNRNRLAVVCGGSMMYIDTLLHGIDPLPDISAQTREYVLAMLANHGLEGVLAQLRICTASYKPI